MSRVVEICDEAHTTVNLQEPRSKVRALPDRDSISG